MLYTGYEPQSQQLATTTMFQEQYQHCFIK